MCSALCCLLAAPHPPAAPASLTPAAASSTLPPQAANAAGRCLGAPNAACCCRMLLDGNFCCAGCLSGRCLFLASQVVGVCCTWGAVKGVVPSVRDAFEIYVAEAGLNPLPPGRHDLREVLEKGTAGR